MPPSKVADRATVSSNTASTTADFVLTGMTVGNLLIIRCAADNAGGGGAATSATVSNQSGTPISTTTDLLYTRNNDPGAASAGVTMHVALAEITATSGTVRITFGASVIKAGCAEEWSGLAPIASVVVGTPVDNVGTASANLAVLAEASVADRNLVYGAIGIEGPNSDTFTQDSDTTGGSWSTLTKVATTIATADQNMAVVGGYKIVTATGAQNYAPTNSVARDSAGIILELAERVITGTAVATISIDRTAVGTPYSPAITQAAYRFYDGASVESGQVIADSYSAWDGNFGVSGTTTGYAQSFTGNGRPLTQVGFMLSKAGTPTGNVTAYLYAHTGTFGSTSKPTGSALATSAAVDPTSLTTSAAWVYFDFDGSVTLTAATSYCVAFQVSVAGDGTNRIVAHPHQTAPSHAGNGASLVGGTWGSLAHDMPFEVYTGTGAYTTTVTLADSYAETNADSADPVGVTGGTVFQGQTFQGTGFPLARVGFYLRKLGAPVGNLTAALYAHTNTFGTNGTGIGAVLATSTTSTAASTLTTTSAWYDFDFDGTYTLTSGTPYVIGVTATGLGDASNTVRVSVDSSASTHAGNGSIRNSGGSWASGDDRIFRVYTNNYTTSVASGDVNLQLRTRLQASTPAGIPSTDDWQLQWEKNTSGSWADVAVTETLADSYAETNADGDGATLGDPVSGYIIQGQSFRGNGQKLLRVGWYMLRVGSPTGNVTATIYAHSGTFGTSSVGTGTALATSTAKSSATMSTTAHWEDFEFDGTLTLTDTTPYVIAVEATGMSSTNCVKLRQDISSATHVGNSCHFDTSWHFSSIDRIFRVYTRPSPAPTTAVAYASANLTDGAATTNRLGAGSGSFVAGKISEDGLVDDLGWSGDNYTELLYSITLKQADLTVGDIVRFRVLRNAATTSMTYTQTPMIEIVSGGPATVTGTAATSITFTGTATGSAPFHRVTGTAAGSLAFSGTATGTVLRKGVAVTSLAFSATATGTVIHIVTGTATASLALSATATGTRITFGTATASLTLSATATGTRFAVVPGTAATSLALSATATGTVVPPVTGTATAALAFSTTATGTVIHITTGTGATSLALSTVATGTVITPTIVTGTATLALSLTTSATGSAFAPTITIGQWGNLDVVGLQWGTEEVVGAWWGDQVWFPVEAAEIVTGAGSMSLAFAATATGSVVVCHDVLAEPFDNTNNWTGTTSIVAGRNGTALNIGGSSSGTYTLSADQSAYATIGFAWKVSDVASAARNIFSFRDTANGDLLTLRTNTTGSLTLLLGGTGGSVLGTSTTGLIAASTWYYLEVQCYLADSGGSVTVRLAGSPVITASGVDTLVVGGIASVGGVLLRGPGSGQTVQFDDLYLSTGPDCTFQGDHAVAVCNDVLLEPFDTLSAWTTAGTPTVVSGRHGTAMQIATNTQTATYTIPSADESAIVTMGFAFRWTDATTVERYLCSLRSDAAGTQHVILRMTAATGVLSVDRAGTALGTSATSLVVANTWYYIEIQATLGDSPNGAVTVHLNGTNVIGPLTGIDTKAGGTKTVFDAVRLIANTTACTNQYDDLYLSTGFDCSFEGDITVPSVITGTATASLGISGTCTGTIISPPTLVGTTVQYTSGSGARTITPHASTATGDLIIVIAGNGTTGITGSPPGGWTTWKNNVATGSLTTGVWAHVRAGGETTYSFTVSGSTASVYVALTVANWSDTIGDAVVGSDGTRAASGATFTNTAPTITATGANRVLCISTERTTATETGISSVGNGFTEYLWAGHGGVGLETTWIGTKLVAPGAVGATSVTYPNTQAANGLAFLLAIPP